jgi:hypothetical protein
MITYWRTFLLEQAAGWGLPANGKWTFLFHNNYHPQCTNLNLLWFHNRGEFPLVITKLSRNPVILEQEFANLGRVHEAAPDSVPRPLAFTLLGGFWSLWMSGVPGIRFRLPGKPGRTKLVAMFETLAMIQARLHKAGQTPDPERYRRMVKIPLESLTRFGTSAVVQAGCARVAEQSSAEWLNALPVIPQHGDLFFGNILTTRGRFYVVDWETFGAIDLPFYDAVTLLFSLLRADTESPQRWNPELVGQAPVLIAAYARRLGLGLSDVSRLVPLILANWFHLQWSDDRGKFTERMYKAIVNYFERPEVWNAAFVAGETATRSR